MPHKKHKSPPANTRKGIQAVKSQFSAPPLSGVTPPIVGICHEVTEGTATVSGCLRSRLRGSQKRLYYSIFSPSVTAKPCHLPRQREARLS